MSKDSLGPIFTTVILMVIALLSIIMFQFWMTTYQQDSTNNIENQQDSEISNFEIETIIRNTLYLKSKSNTILIGEIQIDNNICQIKEDIIQGMNEINIEFCFQELDKGKKEVILTTQHGKIMKIIFI
ncbi:MAG: hypothetical protein PF569_02695 [Candidatus Woesearchaeota archaeon]|jgi:hypothetical protein|nr:hypothetical protein [Candidatus Woesearchaeota archaeon]